MNRRIVAAVSAVILLPFLGAASCGNQPVRDRPAAVEDCDLDDVIEGDEDCYGPKVKKSDPAKPKAKKTRR